MPNNHTMTQNNRIEIQFKKSKLAKFLVISVLFVVGGLWMIISNPQTSSPN